MSLSELWRSKDAGLANKSISQLVAFAGDGNLTDYSEASEELRGLLRIVPNKTLSLWTRDSITSKFANSGFVLQDCVNEVGRRLGFTVDFGRYRGGGIQGYDGLWYTPGVHALIVESKTSVDFTIELDRIVRYRDQIPEQSNAYGLQTSVLLAVGTADTRQLEAQVRGSQFAWDIRLIGIESLLELLIVSERIDDVDIEEKIRQLLIPRQYTRLDKIVELVFATAEENEVEEVDEGKPQQSLDLDSVEPRATPANFHEAIIPRIESQLGLSLIKRGRTTWFSSDETTAITCQVSKQRDDRVRYWFGIKPGALEKVTRAANAYCVFGLGAPERVLLIPLPWLQSRLELLNRSPGPDGEVRHWHLQIREEGDDILMLTQQGCDEPLLNEFLLNEE